jgi:hypothetical protein
MSSTRDPVIDIFANRHDLGPDDGHGRARDVTPSVYLWGTSRPTVNLVLYALARRADPEFAWLDVQDRGSLHSSHRRLDEGSFELRKESVAVRAEDLLPHPPVVASSLSRIVRLDSDPGELDRLQQFIALPTVVQTLAARSLPNSGPRVVAIPNSDRLADLYAGRPDTLRRLIQTMQEISISLVVGRAEGPGPLRNVFDYVFEVRATDLPAWDRGHLVCEYSQDIDVMAVGRRFPLTALTWAADVLAAAAAALGRPRSTSPDLT